MPGTPVSLSYGSSSGVSGDTSSGPIADYYFSAPFAVGDASASSDQAGGNAGKLNPLLMVGLAVGALLVGIVAARLSSR